VFAHPQTLVKKTAGFMQEFRAHKKTGLGRFFIAAERSLSERNVSQAIQIPLGIQCSHAACAR